MIYNIRLCTDVYIDWICAMVSCWISTNTRYHCLVTLYYIWHHRNCILACWSITMTMIYNIRLCDNIDVGWICAMMVSCWISANRKYVGIGACLNLNVSLLDTRHNIYNTIAIVCSPAFQLITWQWHTIYGSAPIFILIEYVQWCRVG